MLESFVRHNEMAKNQWKKEKKTIEIDALQEFFIRPFGAVRLFLFFSFAFQFLIQISVW